MYCLAAIELLVFQSTSSEEDVVSRISYFWVLMSLRFQSTSSEEDVVSWSVWKHCSTNRTSFNPRPPKRTLCHLKMLNTVYNVPFQSTSSEEDVVSQLQNIIQQAVLCFNPRPPKRTLCPECDYGYFIISNRFQSTSSEEDVVSSLCFVSVAYVKGFNPRPPKRTLCLSYVCASCISYAVSIHVLRRGRCVDMLFWLL